MSKSRSPGERSLAETKHFYRHQGGINTICKLLKFIAPLLSTSMEINSSSSLIALIEYTFGALTEIKSNKEPKSKDSGTASVVRNPLSATKCTFINL